MKILRAIGLGLVIIILKFLMTDVFSSFEDTTVLLFETMQTSLEVTDESLRAFTGDRAAE
jgi:hypothetical protein